MKFLNATQTNINKLLTFCISLIFLFTCNISLTLQSEPKCAPTTPSLDGSFVSRAIDNVSTGIKNLKTKFTDIFTQTGSWWIRFLAALILGLLLSLTPCIYPMIPITIGILGVNQSTSAARSFLIASAYAFGISLTFAFLGFLVAIGSCAIGGFQSSPYIIIPLAALLIYFGLSMFDFYEIYIPNFLKPKDSAVQGGSILSALIFGIISGTVASPCLSPGLLLILNYVSNLSAGGGLTNYLQGFLLLFVFGIGSSLPLLIIGTFSASKSIMPRAGAWMIEVKKLIGIMLIGMAFYHLSNLENIIPWFILARAISVTLLVLALHYYRNIRPYDSQSLKIYKMLMAMLLLAASVYVFFQANKASKDRIESTQKDIWVQSLDKAKELAQKENKPIFIDLISTTCAACKSIDKKILQDSRVIETIEKNYIPLKIYYDLNRENYDIVNRDFGPIRGFPTYIFVDKNNKLIKKMGAELGDLSIDEVIKLLIETSKTESAS